jgi:hypothetical protein
MNVEEIKILRMKTGEDVIGFVTDINDSKIHIKYPMMVDIEVQNGRDSYVLRTWLPFQLFKTNEVSLWTNDLVFISDPSDTFIEYYNRMVTTLEKYITATEIMEHLDEEAVLTEVIEEKQHSVIH